MDHSHDDPSKVSVGRQPLSITVPDAQQRPYMCSSIVEGSPSYASSGSSSSWRQVMGGPRKSVLLTSANHNIIHSRHSPSKLLGFYRQDEPKLQYVAMLIAALLLATSLACIAGYDAKEHCRRREAYNINQLFDDDAVIFSMMQRTQEENACVNMFRSVMLPVTVITWVSGLTGLIIIRRFFQTTDDSESENETTALDRQKGHYHVFVYLLCATFPLVVAWTYGIFSVMLRPRNLDEDVDGNNPYQSLAAVDGMGHVGDNANLYYLAWFNMGMAIAVFYEVCIECSRQYRRLRLIQSKGDQSTGGDIEAMLSYTSSQWELYRDRRETWYNSLYRLRIRSGIWVAALLATVVVLASSLLLWRDVLAPAASASSGYSMKFRGVCMALAATESRNNIPPQLCARTAFSILTGGIATGLCVVAIMIHICARYGAARVMDETCSPMSSIQLDHYFMANATKHHLGHYHKLRSEFALSAVLSLLLGLNAVFCTGVQGPAASVGNLYYATWISFLFCLRITLGCLEETYNLNREQQEEKEEEAAEGMEMKLTGDDVTTQASSDAGASSTVSTTDLFDNERARRLRRHLFLGIFSTVCSASAIDAAFNQSNDLTADQWFVIVAPNVVAILCIIQFILCLGPVTYVLISHICIGGSLSVFMFLIWLVDLIITMHSKNSWAVNKIGDIKIANLYYFSWASIVTAGVHMSTYLKKLLPGSSDDYMTVVWMAMVKVCFVILGASFHIWHNIQHSCGVDEIRSGSAGDFCSRTVLAIVVSLVGMAIGGLVSLTRLCLALCWPKFNHQRLQAYVEMILSGFLLLVFGVALALITGIGGPGQSVGDLYYASWLAFVVSIGIVVSCCGQIHQGDTDWQQQDVALSPSNCSSSYRRQPETAFVEMK